jgi:formylglycine-generating enzyme
MRYLPGGIFTMGSNHFYPEERPRRKVRVDPFWIDETPVTNRQFAEFVAATGYRTLAGRSPLLSDYPGMRPEMARAGSRESADRVAPYSTVTDFARLRG